MSLLGIAPATQVLSPGGSALASAPYGAASSSSPAARLRAAAAHEYADDVFHLPPGFSRLPAFLQRVSVLAGRLPSKVPYADQLEYHAGVAAREIAQALGILDEFFAGSQPDLAAIGAREGAWAKAAAAQDAAAGDVLRSASALETAWTGEAATGAHGLTRCYAALADAADPVLAAIGRSTAHAGVEFAEARYAAIAEVMKVDAALRGLAVVDPPRIDWGWPDDMLDDLRAWVKAQYDEVVAAVSTVRYVLDNVAAAARPGTTRGCGQLGHVAALTELLERANSALETGKDPGPIDRSVQGEWAAILDGSEHKEIDAIMLGIVANHRGDGRFTLPPGWEQVDPESVGIPAELARIDEIGYATYVYREAATGRLVITFGGTDFGTAEDVMEDAIGGVTYSHHSAAVVAVVDALRATGHLDEAVFGGFSLGGRLATVASMESGQPAVIFNAAGTSDPTIAYQAGLRGTDADTLAQQSRDHIRLYKNTDDTLTVTQERSPVAPALPDAMGTPYWLPPAGEGGADNFIERHMPGNVIDGYNKRYGARITLNNPGIEAFEER